jgi:hypothetical protein
LRAFGGEFPRILQHPWAFGERNPSQCRVTGREIFAQQA